MLDSNQKITVFLTFPGTADEAVNFYMSVFPGGKIIEVARFGPEGPGEEGKILTAAFELMGQQFYAMDMIPDQATAFSWATSLLVVCSDEPEFDRYFADLSEGGTVMMGPEAVMDLRKATWVTDRFGVTWQLVWK